MERRMVWWRWVGAVPMCPPLRFRLGGVRDAFPPPMCVGAGRAGG